jgi:predicted Zn-dependent peptidase
MKQTIVQHTLPNGLRIVVEEMPQLRSATIGLWICHGSRHEQPQEAGLSHFIEHLVFKGSQISSCLELAQRIDQLGGNVDAYTSREKTSYVAKVIDSQFIEAMELLSEIVLTPAFVEKEVATEREVVLEEIRMVNDTPDDLVLEIFNEQLYGDHPLGRSILGTPKSVSAFNRDTVLSFFGENYRPDRMILAVAGNVQAQKVMEIADRLFGGMKPNGDPPLQSTPRFRAGTAIVKRRNLEQVQLTMAVEAFSIRDERRNALEILNTYLGGSMSSRLFQNVRERLGLAYSVNSFSHLYSDCGYLAVYAATGPERIEELVKVIRKELESVARGEISREDINRVKSMIRNDVVMGMESSGNRMTLLAKQLIAFGTIKNLDQLIAEFDSVTYEEVIHLAAQLLDGAPLTAVALGPVGNARLDFNPLGS